MSGSGEDRLWLWFGLGRATFITMPRVLAHAMPDAWQDKMAALLEEYDAAFPNQPNLSTYVSCRVGTRWAKFPDWVLNYRYPDTEEIDRLRPGPEVK